MPASGIIHMTRSLPASRKSKRFHRSVYKKGFVSRVKKVVNSMTETKFKQSTTTQTDYVVRPASVRLLNGMAVGDEEGQRDGYKIKMTNVYVNGVVYATATIGAPVFGQAMLVYWKNPNGIDLTTVAPIDTGADGLFQEKTSLFGNDPINPFKRDEFIVLAKKNFVLEVSDKLGDSGRSAEIINLVGKFSKKKKARYGYVEWDGDSNSNLDLQKGALYLVVSGSITTSTVKLDYSYKIYYKDM